MKIVIPGAAGFVAVNLLQRIITDPALNQYEQLVLIDPLQYGMQRIPPFILKDARCTFIKDSIYRPGVAEEVLGEGDLVIHLAAETNSFDQPQQGVDDNPVVYLRAILKAKVRRLLFMSSADVYGRNNSSDLTEADAVAPTTMYAAAKASFEAFLSAFHASFGLPVVIFRPVTIYGPEQYPGWLVPVFITRALAGERLIVAGDGSARRDWIHVDDVCELLVRAALHTDPAILGQVFNVGTGTEISVLDLARHILQRIEGPSPPIEFVSARRGDLLRQITKADKARRVFDWTPSITLHDGLDATIAHYRRSSAEL